MGVRGRACMCGWVRVWVCAWKCVPSLLRVGGGGGCSECMRIVVEGGVGVFESPVSELEAAGRHVLYYMCSQVDCGITETLCSLDEQFLSLRTPKGLPHLPLGMVAWKQSRLTSINSNNTSPELDPIS